jgi:membrane peptidoglycan carboxypeptidase
MATAALANDGERMRPRLILAKKTPVGQWQTLPPVSAGQAISPEAAQNVMEMLETVVSASGTGRQAALAGVRVAGKTGTAQLLDPNGSYSRTRHTAWFIGFAPAEDPKVAIVVGLEEPSNGGGGAVAAPLFAKVAAAQLARHGILTFPEPIAAVAIPREPMHPAPRNPIAQDLHEGRRGIRPVAKLALADAQPAPRTPAQFSAGRPAPKRPTNSRHSVLVPNFQGISLNSARSLASDEFLELRFRGPGRGQVIRQDPAPGTILGGSQRTVVVSFSADQGEG